MRRHAADRDTAPAGAGRRAPRHREASVAVRAHYGALPSMADAASANGGESCRDQRSLRGRAAARKHGPGSQKSPLEVADGASCLRCGAPERRRGPEIRFATQDHLAPSGAPPPSKGAVTCKPRALMSRETAASCLAVTMLALCAKATPSLEPIR